MLAKYLKCVRSVSGYVDAAAKGNWLIGQELPTQSGYVRIVGGYVDIVAMWELVNQL